MINSTDEQFIHDLNLWKAKLQHDEAPIHLGWTDTLFEKNTGFPHHPHPEIFLQIEGTTEFTLPKSQFKLRPGEIAIIPKGVPHGEKAIEGKKKFLNIVIMNRPGVIHLVYSHAVKHPQFEYHIPSGFEGRLYQFKHLDPSLEIINQCIYFLENNHDQGRSARSILSAYLDVIQQSFKNPIENINVDDYSPLISKCLQIVEQNYFNSFYNVRRLSQELECTPNHLSMQFKKETNQKLSAYLMHYRLNHSKDLLSTTTMSIKEVASNSGFEHDSHFIAQFKKNYKTTPKKYKERHRSVSD